MAIGMTSSLTGVASGNRITPADISDPQELIKGAAELSAELDVKPLRYEELYAVMDHLLQESRPPANQPTSPGLPI
jgi:hypothetical protein